MEISFSSFGRRESLCAFHSSPPIAETKSCKNCKKTPIHTIVVSCYHSDLPVKHFKAAHSLHNKVCGLCVVLVVVKAQVLF